MKIAHLGWWAAAAALAVALGCSNSSAQACCRATATDGGHLLANEAGILDTVCACGSASGALTCSTTSNGQACTVTCTSGGQSTTVTGTIVNSCP